MKILPIALVYSRLAIGLLIVLLSIAHVDHYPFIAILLLNIGLVTDIFDGIIARQLEVSTPRLRRLDSSIDQVFFICVLIATYIQYPDFFKSNSLKVLALLGLECLAYLVCFLKFRKEIATHTIGAKVWTLLLVATLIEIIHRGESLWLFNFCFWIGLFTRLEIIGIILALRQWTTDVPSFFHALRLRQGKEIKRHKMFNG
jgi:CDP-diacylglycerol--glycerol-3-phosphate 3-phosphatidyltransferase